MTLKYTILVLIGDTFSSLTDAEHVCSSYNTRYGGDVYFCDAQHECCEEGCCFAANYAKFLWILLFSLLFVIPCWYFCAKYCCRKSDTGRNVTTSNARPIASPQFELPVNRTRYELPMNRSGCESPMNRSLPSQNLYINTVIEEQEDQHSGNSHPITPPPPYEVVMATSLQVDNRVPSYDDVMAAKNKISK